MSFIQKIKKQISSVDMFASSQMLRYNSDAQYQTITGGIISIGVTLVVIAGFFNMIFETLNRTAISSSLNIATSSYPPAANMITNAENMNMFALQIQSQDVEFNYKIGGERRYFDLIIMESVLKYGIFQSERAIKLALCTDEHFKMLPQVINNKDLLYYSDWYCPTIGQNILLQGSYFTEDYSYINIDLKKCTNSSDPDRPCHPQQQIDDLLDRHGNFYFTVNYLNTVINPTQVEYRSYYIEPMDYLIFSKHTGAELHYLFSDYQITSDYSIWPFQDIRVDRGLNIVSRPLERTFSVDQNIYAYVFIAKSPNSYQYTRSVQKLSVVFSYIGGLVGAISAVLFLVKVYTDTSLEIAIACNIFSYPLGQSQNKKEITVIQGKDYQLKQASTGNEGSNKLVFSIFSFLKYSIYQVLKSFKFTENWKRSRKFDQFRNEIVNHLDIKVLLQRIINMERYVSYLFNSSQLTCLKHQQKIPIDEIKRLRLIFTAQSHDPTEEDGIDEQMTENQLFMVTENAPSKMHDDPKNLLPIGNPGLKQQMDNQSSFQFQKDTLNGKKQGNANIAYQNTTSRFDSNNKNKIRQKTLKDFQKVNQQQSSVNRKIWANMKSNVKVLIENQTEQKTQYYHKKRRVGKTQRSKSISLNNDQHQLSIRFYYFSLNPSSR